MVALIPLRDPGSGKTRLAPHLSPSERAGLAAAMLSDTVGAIRAAPVDRVVVAASGGTGAAAASALGLDVLLDPPSAPSLDEVLRVATARLSGASALLVVAADLPCLRPEEVAALLDLEAQVVVAPTGDGGTGGLLRRPPAIVPTAFGPGSAATHMRLAHQAGVQGRTASLPGFHNDVDTWADLQALVEAPVGPTTAAFLERISPRLDATP